MSAAVATNGIVQAKQNKKTLRASLQDTFRHAASHVKGKASRDALPDLSGLRTLTRSDKGKERESVPVAPASVLEPSNNAAGDHRPAFLQRFNGRTKTSRHLSSSVVPSAPSTATSDPKQQKDPTWAPFQAPSLSAGTFSSPALNSPPLSIDAPSSPNNASSITLVPGSPRPLMKRPPVSGARSRLTSPSSPSLLSPDPPPTPSRRSSQRQSDTSIAIKPSSSRNSNRSPSPVNSRSPTKPLTGIVRASRPPTLTSRSTSHLPLASPPSSPSPTSPPPSPSNIRRNSNNAATNDSRATSPTASTSNGLYSQRHNASTASLALPLSPQRKVIRLAATFIVKEATRPPTDLGALTKQWIEEMDLRTTKLARIERMWNKSNGTGTSSGEDRERQIFCEALRDGYVLCQLLNKWKPNLVTKIDHKEDGVTKFSNMNRFIVAAGIFGVPSISLCSRQDFVECSPTSMMRVAQTILALAKVVDSASNPTPTQHSPYGEGKDRGFASASTPNLAAPSSPIKKRFSPAPRKSDEITPPISQSPPPPPPPVSTSRTSNRTSGPAVSRTSLASSIATETSAYSSLLNDKSKFGSVRTNITEATSMVPSTGVPSLSRSDARFAAYELENSDPIDFASSPSKVARKRSSHGKPGEGLRIITSDSTDTLHELPRTPIAPVRRERRSSEAASDLMRVTEENDDDGIVTRIPPRVPPKDGRRERDRRESAQNNIKLGKGKWPDDFMSAFSTSSPPSSPVRIGGARSPADSPTRQKSPWDGRMADSPTSMPSSPSPTGTEGEGDSSADQRTARAIRVRSNGAKRESPEQGSSPNPDPSPVPLDPAPADGRKPLRRSSARGHLVRKASPRGDASPYRKDARTAATASNTSLVGPSVASGSTSAAVPIPFPRRSSVDMKHPSHPSSASPRLDTLAASSEALLDDLETQVASSAPVRTPLRRARFQSEMSSIADRPGRGALDRARSGGPDDLKQGRRSRFESMMDIGGRVNEDEKGPSRRILIVKEEGSPTTHYQLGNCIGKGQFGSVYRALNLNTGQTVAVKQIRLEGLSESEVMQLMKEVDLLKSLSHPSVVKYEGMARDSDTLSIVLEYVENGSLGQTLKAFGKLNERLVAGFVTKILEGLDYLHRCQVVHCDLKAANILTTKNGNVKLSDFGVSLNLRAMEQIKNDVAGTPNWMAPEVIELKGASTASDIWSLGCTVIELLTGKPPYAEIQNGLSVMFHIVEDSSPPLPDGCSEALKDFFAQCFNKDPERRPTAELLFEHPWLKSNWGEFKELRPQDSIPFLRRVSADLQRTSLAHQISFVDTSPSRDPTPVTPIVEPRQHAFVKTSFSQAVECRVCYTLLKRSAVLCQGCSLICHSRCTGDAPASCDYQEQMRSFAQRSSSPPPARAQTTSMVAQAPLGEPALSGSPTSFPVSMMAGFRKLRHSASSVATESIQPSPQPEERRTTQPLPNNSIRSSVSGGGATSVGSRVSARLSMRAPSEADTRQRESIRFVPDTPSQRLPSSPATPALPPSSISKHKTEQSKSRDCVIQ